MIKVLETDYLEDSFINKQFINNISINEKIHFCENDIYYFGNYKQEKLEEIKYKISKNKKNIVNAIEKGIKIIISGNSFDLFNNNFKYTDPNLYTSYSNNRINTNKIKVINSLDKPVDSLNFKYKNLICIKNLKTMNKLLKKSKNN